MNQPHLEIQAADMHKQGWFIVTHIGAENVYFYRMDGRKCFVKID